MTTSDPVLLLPVKPPASGKSRLSSVHPALRRQLARAFALDTLTAVRSVPDLDRVIVVTTDAEFGAATRNLGAEVRPDQVPGDLNRTLSAVARELDPHQFVLALCADLPALRGEEIASVLATTPLTQISFVRDFPGDGSTTYAAPARLFDPHFGVASAAAHLAAGAVEIGADLVTLRADVDDAADLERAISLGVGLHTMAALNLS